MSLDTPYKYPNKNFYKWQVLKINPRTTLLGGDLIANMRNDRAKAVFMN